MIPHYSPPNTSSDWRRVIVIRYLAADCRLGREAYQDFRTGAGFPRECTHTTEATTTRLLAYLLTHAPPHKALPHATTTRLLAYLLTHARPQKKTGAQTSWSRERTRRVTAVGGRRSSRARATVGTAGW